jgi:hypothetical protein
MLRKQLASKSIFCVEYFGNGTFLVKVSDINHVKSLSKIFISQNGSSYVESESVIWHFKG